VTEHGVLLNQT